MEKITASHLSRQAYVYIRQSSLTQVQHNVESRRVQERLAERAQALGWKEPRMIDDDLGCSASGTVERAGFERLLSAVCAGEVGAIFAFEASRLARNGREWHTLLEMCAVVDTVIIDTEAVYDPKLSNDRLLLGVKGTLSELELGLFRARSQAAVKEKVRRGEYYGMVAVGYRKTKSGSLEKEPDMRVQRALEFMFQKFAEFGSARQLVRWMREEDIKIPRREYFADDAPFIWCAPTQSAITAILRNPVYSGAYVFGKTKRRTVLEHGRKRVLIERVTDYSEWSTLIEGHHAGYISWEQYKRNRATLRENMNMKGGARSAVRGGVSVFAGILRCSACGRKVLVNYGGDHGRSIRYSCATNCRNDDGKRCISFSANALERALSAQLLEALAPLGIEAALQAAEMLSDKERTLREQRELELTQARYESERARSQYNAVDPLNRLVASELERRWNAALQHVSRLEEELKVQAVPDVLSSTEREELMALGADLQRVWSDVATPAELKKRIARLLIKEIVLFDEREQTRIRAMVHWQGGEHTEVIVPRATLQHNSAHTQLDTIEIIRALARQMHDRFITKIFNRLKLTTARGCTWSEARVRAIRHGHNIATYQEGERESRGEFNVLEAARMLGVDRSVIYKLIEAGHLPASQACPFAPWVILKQDLYGPTVQQVLRRGKVTVPCEKNPGQLSLEIQ